MLDCAIIGGGPAGLSAALVLGRARRKVMVFDNNAPRNAVTRESHGFLTRDGISPGDFRKVAQQDVDKYPSVQRRQAKIIQVARRYNGSFGLLAETGEWYEARKIILATGLREVLPAVNGLTEFYGKSLFNCPYCDGWELRDRPLVIISETDHAHHMAKILYNWSRDLLVCTNGKSVLTAEQKQSLSRKEIMVEEQRIRALSGRSGQLEKVIFEDGREAARSGGFVTPLWFPAAPFAEALGCTVNKLGGIMTDALGRTNVEGVYAAGDSAIAGASQLIIAAAEGSKAASGVNFDLTNEDF